MNVASLDHETPLGRCGGEEAVQSWLRQTYPDVEFAVGDDAVGVFVKFVLNAPGAPATPDLHQRLLDRFGPALFKLPFFIDSQFPAPDRETLCAWRRETRRQAIDAGVLVG